jgi:hypothetical protein
MAQTTKSSSRRSTSSRSRSNKTSSRNGASSSSRSTRSRNGASATTRRAPRKRKSTADGPVAKTGEKVSELASKASKAPQSQTVRRTGKKVGDLASKAKTPLVAGGAALAGIAGGVALKNRTENRRPIGKLKTRSLPSALRNLDLSKVDLDALTDAARRVRSLGEQVGDVADAADKTRKKHR